MPARFLPDMTPPERSFFENIFLSPAEARLRAGWRLIIQTILMLIVMAGLGILASLFVFIFHWGTSGNLLFILNTLIEFIAITASVYPARRCPRQAFFCQSWV